VCAKIAIAKAQRRAELVFYGRNMRIFPIGVIYSAYRSGVTAIFGRVIFGEHSSTATITIFDETRWAKKRRFHP
jgi:hypothetical protein